MSLFITFEGVEGIASVIRDASGSVIAGMAISVPVFRMNEDNRKRMTTLVEMGTSLISYRLGHNVDNPVRDINEIILWWEQNKLDSTS